MTDNARPEEHGAGTGFPPRGRATPASVRTVFTELGRRAHAVNLAFWTLFGALQASSRLLLPSGDVFPYPRQVIASAMVSAYTWALLTPAIFQLAARVTADQRVRLRRVAQVLVIGLVVGVFASAVAAAVNALLVPRPGPPPGQLVPEPRRGADASTGIVGNERPPQLPTPTSTTPGR